LCREAFVELLKATSYYEIWAAFATSTLSELLSTQTAPQVISEAKPSNYLTSNGNLASMPGSNFSQVMFGGERSPQESGGGGFFDDDDDDDDIDDDDNVRGFQNTGFQSTGLQNTTADFAHFDAFSASMSPQDNVFSFASFDNPDAFAPNALTARLTERVDTTGSVDDDSKLLHVNNLCRHLQLYVKHSLGVCRV
jgi:hypothetical protein